MERQAGFTLIELMIVVAIIGLLVAVALPSYQSSVRKSNRSDAQITLSRLATLEEQYFFRANQYSNDFSDFVSGAASGATITSDEEHYSIAVTLTNGGRGWSMTATPQGQQANDTACASLTLTHLGVKTALDSDMSANPECWQ